MKTKLLTICLLLFTSQVFAEDCKGYPSPNFVWDNCFGTHPLPNGDVYAGEWKNNEFNGHGTYTYANGASHVGEWKDGKKHGQGVLTYPEKVKYVGEWKDGKRHGCGTVIFPDGGHNAYVKDGNISYNQCDIEHWPIIGLWKAGYSTESNDGGYVKALIIFQENNLYKYIYLNNLIIDPQPFYWADDQTGEETLHNTKAEDTIHFDKPIFNKEGFSTKKELIQELAGEGDKGHIEEMSFAEGIRIFFWSGETKEDIEWWSKNSRWYFVKDQTIDTIKLSGIIECVRNSSDDGHERNFVNEYFGKEKKKLPESRQCLGKKINYFIRLSPHADD